MSPKWLACYLWLKRSSGSFPVFKVCASENETLWFFGLVSGVGRFSLGWWARSSLRISLLYVGAQRQPRVIQNLFSNKTLFTKQVTYHRPFSFANAWPRGFLRRSLEILYTRFFIFFFLLIFFRFFIFYYNKVLSTKGGKSLLILFKTNTMLIPEKASVLASSAFCSQRWLLGLRPTHLGKNWLAYSSSTSCLLVLLILKDSLGKHGSKTEHFGFNFWLGYLLIKWPWEVT